MASNAENVSIWWRRHEEDPWFNMHLVRSIHGVAYVLQCRDEKVIYVRGNHQSSVESLLNYVAPSRVLCEQAVEQTVELSVIWDALPLLWRHCCDN